MGWNKKQLFATSYLAYGSAIRGGHLVADLSALQLGDQPGSVGMSEASEKRLIGTNLRSSREQQTLKIKTTR